MHMYYILYYIYYIMYILYYVLHYCLHISVKVIFKEKETMNLRVRRAFVNWWEEKGQVMNH